MDLRPFSHFLTEYLDVYAVVDQDEYPHCWEHDDVPYVELRKSNTWTYQNVQQQTSNADFDDRILMNNTVKMQTQVKLKTQ